MPVQSEQLYRNIIKSWKEQNTPVIPFTGNFLYEFISSLCRSEGLNFCAEDVRSILETGSISNYTGNITGAFQVLNHKCVSNYYVDLLSRNEDISVSVVEKTHNLLYPSIESCQFKFNSTFEFMCVKDLCAEINLNPNNFEPLQLASLFLCNFESINVFSSCDNISIRWLINYILTLNNHPPVLFTFDNNFDYYTALGSFIKNGNCEPMYEYLIEQVITRWKSILEKVD